MHPYIQNTCPIGALIGNSRYKMTTIWEETKAQGAKMKGRSLREKLEYFWEYYRIHTLVAAVIIILVGSLVHAWATAKDEALSIVLINSLADTMEETIPEWTYDLTELLDFDPKKYEVAIDTSVMLGSDTATANQEYASSQKLVAMMGTSSIDILVSDTAIFEQYAQNECFCDLRNIYTPDELDAMSDIIYYTDASTFSDYDAPDLDTTEKQAAYVVDHRDPSSMKEPIPVGLFMTEDTRIGQSGIYAYLTAMDEFQGHPKEAVLGIPVNTKRLDAALLGTEYLMGD